MSDKNKKLSSGEKEKDNNNVEIRKKKQLEGIQYQKATAAYNHKHEEQSATVCPRTGNTACLSELACGERPPKNMARRNESHMNDVPFDLASLDVAISNN